MKRVLLITICFPPEEGGGTIRAAKLVKYLPMFGWCPTVVTAMPPNSKSVVNAAPFYETKVYRAPRVDIAGSCIGMVKMIRWAVLFFNEGIKTLKSKHQLTGNPPTTVSTPNAPRRRLAEFLFIPDDRVTWVPIAVVLGIWSLVKDRPSIIYSTSPSPSTLLVGYILKHLAGLPWIIEFRDPWMLNPFRGVRPIKWMEFFETWLEKTILCKSDHIVVTSLQYKNEILNRYPQLSSNVITYIPNGFDPDDFKDITPRSFKKFTIVHTGSFYAARSSIPFLKGLRTAIDRFPELMERIQVFFIGQPDSVTEQAVIEFCLENIVRQEGVVSHRKSIESIMGADILLLVPGPGDGTMPGKTFEYLAGRKPILALADEGVVSELIITTGTGVVVAPNDYEGISEALVRLYKTCSLPGGYPYPACDSSDVLKQFDRKEIASKTACLMDTLVPRCHSK